MHARHSQEKCFWAGLLCVSCGTRARSGVGRAKQEHKAGEGAIEKKKEEKQRRRGAMRGAIVMAWNAKIGEVDPKARMAPSNKQ